MRKRRVENKSDWISDLPVSILHHVLSHLSFEDSVRTSVLSKRWNSVQKSFPILEFKPPIDFWRCLPRFEERLREYLDCVDRYLQNFVRDSLRIEKLDLQVTRVDLGSVPLVDTWLPLALHNGVSDLSFHVFLKQKAHQSCFYTLPETTFALDSSLLRGSSKFFVLEKLELSCVRLTEKIVQDIIRNCPNLTDLQLSDFYSSGALTISKFNKLVTLGINVAKFSEELTNVFVDVLSLERLSLHFQIAHLPCSIDLTSCRNLKEFEIWNSAITDADFSTNISRLSLLEVLIIRCACALRTIRISLQRLKRLILECCHFENIEIDAPVLSEFVLKHSLDDEELPVLVLPDPIPACMFVTYIMDFLDDLVDSFWFFKIREYLNVPVKGITFSLENYSMFHDDIRRISFDLNELRELMIPPPLEIDCLDLTLFNHNHSSDREALLDGLLWSCHPKKVYMAMMVHSSDEDNWIKTICRMFHQRECQLCCNLSHCQCWRRRFKAATIESTGDILFDEINIKSVTRDLFLKPKYRRVRFGSSIGKSYSKPVFCSLTLRFDWET